MKSKKKFNLIVVAHPDDETLFFAGLMLSVKSHPWKVICVTDGNADGQGALRADQLAEACHQLKVKSLEHWNFPDIYEQRLNIASLVEKLAALEDIHQVYTHGILGEYGHPHHQDVSMAVHLAFPKVFSVAYNCFAQKLVKLSPKQYQLKSRILSTVYLSETRRFAPFLPSTFVEGFTTVDLKEAQLIYQWITKGIKPDRKLLKIYGWYFEYLKKAIEEPPPRPF